MTDYEKVYQRCGNACGQPFDEFVAFFDAAETELSVLDLGCGQGRDSLMAARRGHHVHAVDLAPTGIAQVIARAKAEELGRRRALTRIRGTLNRSLGLLRTAQSNSRQSKHSARRNGNLLLDNQRARHASLIVAG